MNEEDQTPDALPSAKRPISPEEMLGMALISLATPLAGGLIGGKEGAMIGAQAGLQGTGKYLGTRSDEAKKEVEFDRQLAIKDKDRQQHLQDQKDLKDYEGEIQKDVASSKQSGKAPPTMVIHGKLYQWDEDAKNYVDTGISNSGPAKQAPLGQVMQDPKTGQWYHWNGSAMVPVQIQGAAPAADAAPAGGATPTDGAAPPLPAPTLVKPGAAGKGGKDSTSGDAAKLVKELKGSSRDALGTAKSKMMAAERVDALIQEYPDGNMPPQLMHELAISMATMLSPGVPAESTIHGLKADTIEGKLAELGQKITGEPIGAGQQAFTQMMSKVVKREREVANDQYKREVARILPGYKKLRESDPDTWDSILQANGLSRADFDEKGHYKPKAGAHEPAKGEKLPAHATKPAEELTDEERAAELKRLRGE